MCKLKIDNNEYNYKPEWTKKLLKPSSVLYTPKAQKIEDIGHSNFKILKMHKKNMYTIECISIGYRNTKNALNTIIDITAHV